MPTSNRTVKNTSCAVCPLRAMAFKPCGVGHEMRTRKWAALPVNDSRGVWGVSVRQSLFWGDCGSLDPSDTSESICQSLFNLIALPRVTAMRPGTTVASFGGGSSSITRRSAGSSPSTCEEWLRTRRAAASRWVW